MRDGRLSASSRALVLKSCGANIVAPSDPKYGATATRVMLSDTVIPSHRSFKTYLPTNSDSTLFRSPIPRSYTSTGAPITENIQPANTPVESSTNSLNASPLSVENTACEKDSSPECSMDASSEYTRETLVNHRDSLTSASSSSSTSPTSRAVLASSSTSSLQDTTPKESSTPKQTGPSSATASTGNITKSTVKSEPSPAWHDSYKHIDCEWSMRTMDALFNASFVDFIKNEKNCEFNGRHVAHLVKDYKLDQVVQGIKWLVDGWAIESTARLLKSVFDDWLPELAAFAIARIGCEWQLRPKMGLIVAFMMMGESPNVAALFIRSLTIGWDSAQITELISCLDTVLEWEDDYFTKFTELLLLELKEASRVGEIHDVDPNVIIKALASMYKTTAAMTNHRIVMADLRLAVAKSHYLTQFAHSITCQDCLHRKPCAFSSRALTPNPASIIAAMRNRIRPNVGGRGGFTIQPNGSFQPTVPSENSSPPPPNQSTDNSSNDFSYLLDRIPPSLREFFGAATSTTGGSETEFTIPESTQDFLYNFDEDELADFDQDYDDDDDDDNDDLDEDHDDRYNDENDSILNNPLLTPRSNSFLSILQSHAVGPVVAAAAAAAGSGSVFSRGTSENSFLSARQGAAPPGLTSGGGLVLPNTVFETHQPSIDSFRSASSMMSLALSSLDLTGNSNSVGGAFGGDVDASNLFEGNQSRVLTRNESTASFKSSENL